MKDYLEHDKDRLFDNASALIELARDGRRRAVDRNPRLGWLVRISDAAGNAFEIVFPSCPSHADIAERTREAAIFRWQIERVTVIQVHPRNWGT